MEWQGSVRQRSVGLAGVLCYIFVLLLGLSIVKRRYNAARMLLGVYSQAQLHQAPNSLLNLPPSCSTTRGVALSGSLTPCPSTCGSG